MKKLAVLFVAVMLVVAMTVPSLAAVSMAIKTPVETPPHVTSTSQQAPNNPKLNLQLRSMDLN